MTGLLDGLGMSKLDFSGNASMAEANVETL